MWGAFWVWMGGMTALRENTDWFEFAFRAAVPGLPFLALSFLPAWNEWIGGAALVTTGCLLGALDPLLFGGLPAALRTVGLVVTALPPVVAGAAFLAEAWRNSRQERDEHPMADGLTHGAR